MKKNNNGIITELRGDYRNIPCVVLLTPHGFRNGYVGVKEDTHEYGLQISRLQYLRCPGGITYSKDYLAGQTEPDIWWIGFDTVSHPLNVNDVMAGCHRLVDQILDMPITNKIPRWAY